jgi:predicted nucleotidyltransferase
VVNGGVAPIGQSTADKSCKFFYLCVVISLNKKEIKALTGTRYIPLIVDRLMATQPEKIILFGSYAYGEPNINSDLDILVVTGDENIPASFSEKSKIYLRISKAISDIKKEFPVDLIVHTKPMHQKFIEIDSLFARELLSKGKVLYEKHS